MPPFPRRPCKYIKKRLFGNRNNKNGLRQTRDKQPIIYKTDGLHYDVIRVSHFHIQNEKRFPLRMLNIDGKGENKKPDLLSLFFLIFFPITFLFSFYLSMKIAVDAMQIEIFYVLLNYASIFLATAAFLFLPGATSLYLFLLLLLLVVPTVITASYMVLYKQPVDQQIFYFLWETNLGESKEFLNDALSREPKVLWVGLTSLVLPSLVFIFFWIKRKTALMPIKKLKKTLRFLVFVLCIVLLLVLRMQHLLDLNYIYRFYYTFYDQFMKLEAARELSRSAETRIKEMDVTAGRPNSAEETYVVVIGESGSRHHHGLYGYHRATDPNLSALKDAGALVAFNNVSSTSIGTTQSLLQALTFKDQFSELSEFQFSAVDVANAAGFETYWLSNNASLLKHDTLLQLLSINARERIFAKRQNEDVTTQNNQRTDLATNQSRGQKEEMNLTYDEILLGWFEKALSSPNKKKIIFVHLRGSHTLYWYRFPNAFEQFKNDEDQEDGIRAFTASNIVNDYDNSIYYTDHILGEMIGQLEKKDGESWLLYFSDHGEEVYDYREFYGRKQTDRSKYMFDIPFVLWTSESYKRTKTFPAADDFVDRPYELDNVIHTILDLAHIQMPLLDHTKSIVSEQYVLPARFIYGESPYLMLPPQGLVNEKTAEREIDALEQLLKSSNEQAER